MAGWLAGCWLSSQSILEEEEEEEPATWTIYIHAHHRHHLCWTKHDGGERSYDHPLFGSWQSVCMRIAGVRLGLRCCLLACLLVVFLSSSLLLSPAGLSRRMDTTESIIRVFHAAGYQGVVCWHHLPSPPLPSPPLPRRRKQQTTTTSQSHDRLPSKREDKGNPVKSAAHPTICPRPSISPYSCLPDPRPRTNELERFDPPSLYTMVGNPPPSSLRLPCRKAHAVRNTRRETDKLGRLPRVHLLPSLAGCWVASLVGCFPIACWDGREEGSRFCAFQR